MIANDASWKKCIVKIAAEANGMLGFLKRNCMRLADTEALLLFYSSLVHSHLCYCSQFWAPQSVVNQLDCTCNSNQTVTEKSHTRNCW